MDIWISMHNSQMANNIVKWWKTKFLNGYKQFSVECGDGKVSDTEELLGRLGSEDDINERLKASCTTPPLQPLQHQESPVVTPPSTEENSSTASPKKATTQLNFEEFSCDVSVENGDNNPGQERQEFSFTLYDFDGHGKITKDDIAGLVTTIYEALGSSVKVPHYGSKTIKVKLTVSPDQRKHVSATIINKKNSQNGEKPQESSIRYKRDLNVTIRQGINEKRRHSRKQAKTQIPKKHECCNKHQVEPEPDNHISDDSSDACSVISENISTDEEGGCSDDDKNNQNNNKSKNAEKKCQQTSTPRYTIPNLFLKDPNICNANNCAKVKSLKKRSGSMQRQELLEIIQANMDKNNLSFQTPRKHSNHVISDGNKQLLVESQHKHKAQKVSTSPLQYLANIVDPTHFYVDLASLQNTTHLPQTHCQYDKLIDAVMCVSNKKISLNRQSKCKKHRVKHTFSDIPFQYQLLHYPMTNDENKLNKLNKRTPKKNVNNSEVKHVHHKNSQFVTGHTSSPHHLRHRNRQEDQARAMEQVVRWLEQEFSSNLHMRKAKTKSNHFTQTTKEKSSTTPSTPNSGVERHEHHHVHEHIHHHYHHYQDPPLVV